MIAKEAESFIYVISSMEGTGTRDGIKTDIQTITGKIHEVTDVPVAVNFDINTKEQAVKYINDADGIIIGSAIVKIIEEYGGKAGKHIYNYIYDITQAIGIQ